jgi:RNA polymerase sigma-70 factor, ECF subfamily
VLSGSAEDVGEAAVGTRVVGLAPEDEPRALAELACCLDPMLRQLSPEYRHALVKADLESVPQAALAAAAGVSLSGMKSRVQRARRQLKAVLEACCRVDLDRRGGIMGYETRTARRCDSCG